MGTRCKLGVLINAPGAGRVSWKAAVLPLLLPAQTHTIHATLNHTYSTQGIHLYSLLPPAPPPPPRPPPPSNPTPKSVYTYTTVRRLLLILNADSEPDTRTPTSTHSVKSRRGSQTVKVSKLSPAVSLLPPTSHQPTSHQFLLSFSTLTLLQQYIRTPVSLHLTPLTTTFVS